MVGARTNDVVIDSLALGHIWAEFIANVCFVFFVFERAIEV